MNKILIVAGVHGDEPTAVELALQLADLYRNDMKDSNVMVVPMANPLALVSNTRQAKVGVDTRDMNRMFGDGSLTTIGLVEKMKNLVQDFDIVIDLHNSSNIRKCMLVDMDENMHKMNNICKKAGVKYYNRKSEGSTFKKYVNSIGKFGFTFEVSKCYMVDGTFEEIDEAFILISDFVDFLKNLDLNKLYDKPSRVYEIKSLPFEHQFDQGFFIPFRSLNEKEFRIKSGAPMGRINQNNGSDVVLNNTGKDIEIVAFNKPYIYKGESLCMYVELN